MNLENLTTGSLEARLKDISSKFEKMHSEISNSLTQTCLNLGIEPLRLSFAEYRDPNSVFRQYFTIADIDYCKQNKLAISTISYDLQTNVGSLPLNFKNRGRVQFLTHVDPKGGFIVEIYLSLL